MSDDNRGSVTLFYEQLRGGEEAAFPELWRRFFPRLLSLAERTLSNCPKQITDADDAVQSALASFWRRTREGEFGDVQDRNSLWNLLGTITKRKALQNVRHELAAKRGGGKVLTESTLAGNTEFRFRMDEALAQAPTCELDLILEEKLQQLNESLQQVAILRLLGHTNRDIAEQLNCAERSIERRLQLIRLQWSAGSES